MLPQVRLCLRIEKGKRRRRKGGGETPPLPCARGEKRDWGSSLSCPDEEDGVKQGGGSSEKGDVLRRGKEDHHIVSLYHLERARAGRSVS